jgi:hypothetical protein
VRRCPHSSAADVLGIVSLISMGSISFAIFSFLSRIASRAPDFLRIPHDGVIEVGFRVEI